MRSRLVMAFGARYPEIDVALGAAVLATGVAAVALLGSPGRWAVALLALVVGSSLILLGVWSVRHRSEIAARLDERRRARQRSMRRHPVRWLVGVPAFAAADAALRFNRYHHHSAGVTAAVAGGGAVFGLVIVAIAIRRAQRTLAQRGS